MPRSSPGPRQLEVGLGDDEAVGGFLEDGRGGRRRLVVLGVGEEDAVALVLAAADAAAELVELGEAEALGVDR